MGRNSTEIIENDAKFILTARFSCLPKELNLLIFMLKTLGLQTSLSYGSATVLHLNFNLKEVEKCEDCSGKWFSKEAIFLPVKTWAHT